jgi:serine/threonine-protein kinase
MLEEVLSILDFVHSHGVIHRDIKPDNLIRRNSDNKLVLVDFGAVKQIRTQFAATQGRASNTVAVGTPGYMASEQALGQPRPSSDIYALGIIGIQALTGLMPVNFQEDLSTGEILWQHLVPVSRGFATILTKMVRYHFKDRYQSASEALQALRQLNSLYSSPPYPPVPKTPSANDALGLGQRMPPQPYPTPASEHQTLAASPANPPRQPVATPVSRPSGGSSDKSPLLVGVGVAVAVGAIGLALGLGSRSLGPIFSGGLNGVQVVDKSHGTCTVLIDKLNVRSEPNGSVVDTVQQGTNLALTGKQQSGWVEISSPSRGWVAKSSKKGDLIRCTSRNQLSVETAKANPKPVEAQDTPKPIETTASQKPVEPPKPKPSTPSPKPADNGSDKLAKAADKYDKGDLNGAIADARSVLPGSAAYDEAQAKIKKWQQDWSEATAKYDRLQKALDEGRWDEVIKETVDPKFLQQSYWRDKLKQLAEEAKKQAEAEAQKQNTTPPPEEPAPPKSPPDVTSSDKHSPHSKGDSQESPPQQ